MISNKSPTSQWLHKARFTPHLYQVQCELGISSAQLLCAVTQPSRLCHLSVWSPQLPLKKSGEWEDSHPLNPEVTRVTSHSPGAGDCHVALLSAKSLERVVLPVCPSDLQILHLIHSSSYTQHTRTPFPRDKTQSLPLAQGLLDVLRSPYGPRCGPS